MDRAKQMQPIAMDVSALRLSPLITAYIEYRMSAIVTPSEIRNVDMTSLSTASFIVDSMKKQRHVHCTFTYRF